MKRWKLAAIAALATVAVCLAVTFAVDGISGGDSVDALTLWYTQGDCSAERLDKMKKAYHRHGLFGGGEDGGIAIRCFENEEELAEAFNASAPDLLLCSYARAAGLYERGLLSEEELESFSVSADMAEAAPLSGIAFFPLGSRVQLLVMNNELCADAQLDKSFESLEELTEKAREYTAETGRAFLSAQSYAGMIGAEMCSLGAELTGDISRDSKSRDFVYIYNLLAECGYEDAILALGSRSADYVQAGLLPAACVSSSKLPELSMAALSAIALPTPEKGEKRCPAELLGFSVTGADANKKTRAAAFLEWLSASGEDVRLAVGSGLVPAGNIDGRAAVRWAALFTELARDYEMVYLDRDGERSWADFDASFSQTLDLLR